MAAAYGRSALEVPDSIEVIWLPTSDLVESAFSSLMSPLDVNPQASLAASVDAEWNISRLSGVSVFQVAPHCSNCIYIIPVSALSHHCIDILTKNGII
jgi:hypothetical protein